MSGRTRSAPLASLPPRLPLSALADGPVRLHGSASADERAEIGAENDLESLDALTYSLTLERWRGGVRVRGEVGAELVQRCVVTLDPLPARIEEPVELSYLPAEDAHEIKPGAEYEIVDDPAAGDVIESLSDPVDVATLIVETVVMAIDPYPRAGGDPAEPAVFRAAPRGVVPLEDADVKPFASLATLRSALKKGDGGPDAEE